MGTREEKQNRGCDEAVRGRPPVKLDVMDTNANDEEASRDDKAIDRAADDAANGVRRRDHSAD